jgi:hypothetical protein
MFLPRDMVKISDFSESEFLVMVVMAKEMMLAVRVVMMIGIGIVMIMFVRSCGAF